MSSPARTRPWMQLDLALAIVLSVGAFVATLLGVPVIVRLPLVALLVLFIPGYALLSALIIGSGLSVLERVMIAIVASVCLTIACGLLLALLAVPIERLSWVYLLTGLTLVALVIAWFRRWRAGVEGPHPALARTELRQTALVVIAVLLVANVVALSRIVAQDQFGGPPAQLWLIEGSDPYTADLGFRAGPDGGGYRVVVSSGRDTLHQYDVTLDPGATWDTQLTFDAGQRAQPVVAQLYEGNSVVASRNVSLQALPSNGP